MTLLNREIGILAFNERVLYQAQDPQVPLLERLRFLAIVSSNLDEFFEVRVAGLKEAALAANTPVQQSDLEAIHSRARALVDQQYSLLNTVILPELEKEGIEFFSVSKWTKPIRHWANLFYLEQIEPLITAVALDGAHPFPRIYNKSLNFIVELEGQDSFGRSARYGVVSAPRTLPRVVVVPKAVLGAKAKRTQLGVMLLTSIMQGSVEKMFPGRVAGKAYQFRLTRDSDLDVDDAEVVDLRDAIEDELSERHFGHPVRLEVSQDMPTEIAQFLQAQFRLNPIDTYRVDGPVNLMRLQQVPDLVASRRLKYPLHAPKYPSAFAKGNLFAAIRQRDVLLHHPYESFAPVVEFLRSAATDDKVVAIRQTIYRTGADSQLMQYLIAAAKAGKEVTVVLELMARFDEQANVDWADRLEKVGAHVVYGVVGLKTHAKLAQVIRKESRGLRYYSHIGTGNYHPRTATLYEDFGLFTANTSLCHDVHEVFRRLTGSGSHKPLKHLWLAPIDLHANLIQAIEFEAQQAQQGRAARIAAKMNSLLDPQVIEALYKASQAGVKIDLIVRGVCALRPGVIGQSENIQVRSIVGRFLEHSRVFYFYAAGRENVFLASCDWMERNFFRRVEVAMPVLDPAVKKRVIEEALQIYLTCQEGGWLLDSDGSYNQINALAQTLVLKRKGKPKAIPKPELTAQQALMLLIK